MIDSAPALVAAFQRLAHHVGVAGAVEAVIRPAIEQVDQIFDDIAHILRIDEIGHPELAAPFLPVGIDVHADDPVRARHLRALHAR